MENCKTSDAGIMNAHFHYCLKKIQQTKNLKHPTTHDTCEKYIVSFFFKVKVKNLPSLKL